MTTRKKTEDWGFQGGRVLHDTKKERGRSGWEKKKKIIVLPNLMMDPVKPTTGVSKKPSHIYRKLEEFECRRGGGGDTLRRRKETENKKRGLSHVRTRWQKGVEKEKVGAQGGRENEEPTHRGNSLSCWP